MANEHDGPETVEQEVPATLAIAGGQDIDIQVATARSYPRSIATFIKRAEAMATLSIEVAASCIYALPRKEKGKQKNIEGPSARFAELMASAYQNLRVEGRVVGDDGRYVTARGTSWDVENNVALAYEVKRKITNHDGETYTDDMIVVTGNAAASIAIRNAILKVVPTAFWKPIYMKCRQVVAGDVKTLAVRRDAMLKEFAIMGVTEERLLFAFGLKGKDDITLDHMATLRGFYTALRDGDTTIEEAFPEGGAAQMPQPAQRKSQQQPAPPAPPTAAAPSPAPTPAPDPHPAAQAPADAPVNVGVIVSVHEYATGTLVELNTGFKCATRNADFIGAVKGLKGSGALVELVTHASKTKGNAAILDEIIPVGAEG